MTATNEPVTEAKLVEYLRWVTADLAETRQRLSAVESAAAEPVAVVGMSCRYPGGANTVAGYWQGLLDGLDAIREVPPDRWDAAEFYAEDRAAPGKAYTQHAGFLDDVAGFDAGFFGLTPQEARRLDPQHRLLLELVWEGFEDAGLAPDRLRGSRTGVFVGLIDSLWADRQVDAEGRGLVDDPYVALGSAQGASAGRLAYQFDLRGPTLTVDTACSSSLVAAHLAVQSLRRGECDLAVVGASSVILHPNTFVAGCKMGMLAADGRSKAFDASGDGYGLGEGGGVVVLQRAADAAATGRRVHALLRGSAVNQDGRSNGLTAPNRQAQVALLRTALGGAGLGPNDLDFLEAHGTGTALGDSIEFGALLEVFGERAAEHPLLVGAVKANIGHLHAASGLAGLIKSVLAVKHGEVPRNLHLTDPIPAVTADGPVRPAGRREVLRAGADRPRRAGVSSFGWSGTNAHVIVEQAPEDPVEPTPDAPLTAGLVTLSAASQESLATAAAALADRLESADLALADLAYTTQTGRAGLRHRRALPCADLADAVAALRRDDLPAVAPVPVTEPVLGMLFPGTAPTGADAPAHPAYRAAVDECAALAAGHGVDLPAALATGDPAHRHLLAFVAGYAHATLARAVGVEPTVVSGEGAGEHVADLVAGRHGLGDALGLAHDRDTGQAPAEAEPHPPRISVVPPADLAARADVVVVAGAPPEAAEEEVVDVPVVTLLDPARALGRLWELGVAVDWAAAWPRPGRVVDLPAYSFERTRYWPELVPGAAEPPGTAPRAESPRRVRCHTPTWRRDDALPPATPPDPGTLLVIGDRTRLAAELAAAAAEAGHRVLRAEPGTEYASTDGTVVLDLADPEHHARLLREAAAPGDSPVESTGPLRIVHTAAATAAPTATADDPEPALDAGCHSLLRLAQAVARELPDRAVELVAATADVFDVLGGDGRDPVGATVAGTCRGIDQEYPRIRCRTVDLEAPAETARAAAGQLLREVELLAAGAGEPDTWLTAWRRGRRWLRTFTEVDLPSVEPERVWRPGGSYLVTGGLRGLGLLLATRLAPLRPKLTLVGRTELPAEDDWDAWLAEHGHDDEVSAILLAVRELRAAGAEVLPLTADVTSPEQAERAVRTARERFGTLHGVVHAAGVPGGGPPHARTRQLTADVLAPKVRGTLAVAEALRDDPPELLVLYSSSVGVLGWRGEGDQAAANAFLDAFAASDVVTEKVARRVVSVAWGPWRRGTRSEPDDPFLAEHLRRYRERYGITDDEGVDALTRVAAAGPAQVVVLTQPFAEVAERVGVVAGAEVGHEPDAPAGPKHPRPDLRTPYLAPRTDTERRIAGVWQDYLGIDEIGVHDPFFDIGGTSMVATAVVGGLGRTLGVDLGPASLFDHPTVAELAALIDGTDSPPEPERAGRGGRRRDRR